MAEITTIAALYLLWEFEERNPNAVVFGCMTSSVGAHSWVSFTTSSRNSAWMTAGSSGIFRLTAALFDDLLARVGARISRQDTNDRRTAAVMERL